VIAAGAVVTRPMPDYIVAAGVPARVIEDRRGSEVASSVTRFAGAGTHG
jgi:acetyltransferase-like isoleucine patch superfamily enzyme